MTVLRYLIVAVVAALTVVPASASAASWSQMTTTNPSTSSNQLWDLSCTSTSACTAVGRYTDSENHGVTLAERWNGSTWSTQTTPLLSFEEEASHELLGVSCASANACIAVGASRTFFEIFATPLAESWNGTEWSALSVPSPEKSEFTELAGVSCDAANSCTAVGTSESETLAEHWNGEKWTIQTTPNPEGAVISELLRVSCITSASCFAVGQYTKEVGGTIFTLAEHWNGEKWTIQTTPNPEGEKKSVLLDISCSSTEACTAVAGSSHGENTQKTLVERWNGKEWKIQTSPNPAEAKASVLHGVSCTSSEACIATGDYINSGGKTVTLAESWDGKEWKIQTTVNPTESTFAALWGVWCVSSTNCFAPGYYTTKTTEKTLAEKYS
jgi:hypothetical protein